MWFRSNICQIEDRTGRLWFLHTGDNFKKTDASHHQYPFIYMDPACYGATFIPKLMSRSVPEFCSNGKSILPTSRVRAIAEPAQKNHFGLAELYYVCVCMWTNTSIAFKSINMHSEVIQHLKHSETTYIIYLRVTKHCILHTHYFYVILLTLTIKSDNLPEH